MVKGSPQYTGQSTHHARDFPGGKKFLTIPERHVSFCSKDPPAPPSLRPLIQNKRAARCALRHVRGVLLGLFGAFSSFSARSRPNPLSCAAPTCTTRSRDLSAMQKLLIVFFAITLSACQIELQHGLEEGQANEILVALEAEGVQASKARDTAGGWQIEVSEQDATRAWAALQSRGLPRRSPRTFDDLYPRPGLLASPDEERILLQSATEGKLERSLLALGGVVDARVHLVIPPAGRRGARKEEGEPPRASVLLKVRPEASLPSDQELARLVSGGVHRLSVERVSVVKQRVSPEPKVPGGQEPVRAASSSLWKALLGGAFGLVLLQSAAIVFLLVQRRKEQDRHAS